MKASSLLLSIFVASIVFAGAPACGGGSGGSGEELGAAVFGQRVGELDSQFQNEAEILAVDIRRRIDGAGSEGVRVEAMQDFAEQGLTIFEEYVEGLKDLNPAPEVQDGYDRLVESHETALEAWRTLVDEIEGVSTEADARRLIQELFTGAAFESVSTPCFAETAVGVDLGCQE